MRIKINDEESYEIAINDEYSFPEFIQLLGKLVKVSKIISTETEETPKKVNSLPSSVQKTRSKQRGKARIKWNRELAIKALKIHYHSTKSEKEAFASSLNVPNWNYLLKATSALRRRFDISPQEIGLSFFPKHHNTKKEEVNISNTPSNQSPQPPLELQKKEETEEEKEIIW